MSKVAESGASQKRVGLDADVPEPHLPTECPPGYQSGLARVERNTHQTALQSVSMCSHTLDDTIG